MQRKQFECAGVHDAAAMIHASQWVTALFAIQHVLWLQHQRRSVLNYHSGKVN